MKPRSNDLFKLKLTYDRFNSKYNRLWGQLTTAIFFIFASVSAYSLLYVQYSIDQNMKISAFLNKSIIPIVFVLIPVVLGLTILGTLLVVQGMKVHGLLKDYDIIIY